MAGNQTTIPVIVADDHELFRKGLVNLIHEMDPGYEVYAEAANGKHLLELLSEDSRARIIILDVNMPVMDGFEALLQLKALYPDKPVLALTMLNDEVSLIKLLKAGVDGYLGKDAEPTELRQALKSLVNKGTYYTENIAGRLVKILRQSEDQTILPNLNEQELKFLDLACSEFTYQEIADRMFLSIKTIDGYRARLFEKLNVKSRVGLVLFAIRKGLVELDPS